MRVCTAREMGAIDQATIAAGTPGRELMERAGQAMAELCWDYLEELDSLGLTTFPEDSSEAPHVLVICGKGNNGGDGLVLARLMHLEGAEITVMMLAGRNDLTLDTGVNFDLLPQGVTIVHAAGPQWACTLEQLAERADVMVDAIFGTGIKPPLRTHHVELIRAINDTGLPCLALDIPSGVCGDDGRVDPVAVAADLTVTVGLPKRGLLFRPGRDFTGDVSVVDIGFSAATCEENTADHQYLLRNDYLEMLPPRFPSGHKYTHGTVAILAGSRRFGGAAHLAGLGALRSGVGLVTLAAPLSLELPLRTGLPDLLTMPLAETEAGTIAPLDDSILQALWAKQRAWALGPGLDSHPATDRWVVETLAASTLPVVVDADGLGAFARLDAVPQFGATEAVLTPHAAELGRLIGCSAAEVETRKLDLVPELARRWNVILLLKGSTTLIAGPDGTLYFNTTGDDALARGGSGDILTGLIGGLLAQGMAALEAALLGAYVHGLAGSLAAQGRSTRAVRVTEIAEAMGPVFEDMEKEASGSARLRERIWPVTSGDTT